MHRLEIGTYAGAPREIAALTLNVAGSAQVRVAVDGVDIGPERAVELKSAPGEQTQVQVALFGAVGDSCVVGWSKVDGGIDGDLLVCQPHDPAPIHFYTFIVVQQASLKALARVRRRR